ncbi:hypothetical protein OE749_07085 [Aestuariibacter sp. AA17]|uniref:ATP-grasp domain-containing protein n=1 Tax=Fluctibacter corallii TaxID=2984329 RepID=A0ABT3A7A6_9ALTE|nr:hypothetical protein [Aestuariibacter sp. AA17]MCV2884454.1 hypothetical protein [Aestuariibacter sp. AA17]
MTSSLSILILHRVPFENVGYEKVIDHTVHNVTYLGLPGPMRNIPESLPCRKVVIENLDNLVDTAVKQTKQHGIHFDYVIGVSEYQLIAAAEIREQLNIKGAKPKEVESVRDKMVMKRLVQAAGLEVPRFYSLADVLNRDVTELEQVILKPRDGASSENVIKFTSMNMLKEAISEGTTNIPVLDVERCYDNFEVEEFVVGAILHLDGIVEQGRISKLVTSCYEGTCLSFAEGHALGSFQIETDLELMAFAQDVITALTIESGAFHLEVIKSDNRLVFLEIGHRVGGANVARTFELATGINLHHANLATQLHLPMQNKPAPSHKSYGWFVFPGHHYGWDKCQLEGHEDIAVHQQMLEWNQLSNDQSLPKHITYQKKEVPAAGIIQGDNPDQVVRFMQQVLKDVTVKEAI